MQFTFTIVQIKFLQELKAISSYMFYLCLTILLNLSITIIIILIITIIMGVFCYTLMHLHTYHSGFI